MNERSHFRLWGKAQVDLKLCGAFVPGRFIFSAHLLTAERAATEGHPLHTSLLTCASKQLELKINIAGDEIFAGSNFEQGAIWRTHFKRKLILRLRF